MSLDEKINYSEDDDEKIVYTDEDDKEAMNKEENASSSNASSEASGKTKENNDNKVIMTIGYFSILFLIPMFVESCKKDEFIRHHVNQSIWLFIYGVITGAIKGLFDGLFGITGFNVFNIVSIVSSSVFSVIGLVLLILQLVALWQDQKREIPLVGKIKLYK